MRRCRGRSSRANGGLAFGTLAVWLDDDVSLRFGVGSPVGPAAIGNGFAAFGRIGHALWHGRHRSMVMSLDVTEDTTAGPQVSLLVGFEGFLHTMKLDLWDPAQQRR